MVEKKELKLKLDDRLHRTLKARCAMESYTMQFLIENLVKQYLNNELCVRYYTKRDKEGNLIKKMDISKQQTFNNFLD